MTRQLNQKLFLSCSLIFSTLTAMASDSPLDPMHPQQRTWPAFQGQQSGIELQSILVSPKRNSAIINGQLMTVGARQNNFHVLAIMHDAVIIKQNGQRKILRLNTRDIVSHSSQANPHHE